MLTRLDWQRSITSKATLGQETTLALGMRLVPTNCSHLAGSRERPHPREPCNAPNGAQAWEQLAGMKGVSHPSVQRPGEGGRDPPFPAVTPESLLKLW